MSNIDINDSYAAVDEDQWPTAGTPTTGTGPIGQQIGQKIAGGGTTTTTTGGGVGSPVPAQQWPYGSTSTGNGSTITSTGNGATNYTVRSGATPQVTWNTINSLAQPKPVTKSKARYVIIKNDKSTLELKEQSTITPQEMIGISKFLGLVSTYTVLILGQAIISYNFNIKWSEIIASLGITKHFVPGLALEDYDNDNSEVLDILLYDPQ